MDIDKIGSQQWVVDHHRVLLRDAGAHEHGSRRSSELA
jgi:hypothetical protein